MLLLSRTQRFRTLELSHTKDSKCMYKSAKCISSLLLIRDSLVNSRK